MTPAVAFPPRAVSTVAMRKEASELRKSLKPLLEKRRRARINDCINQLKKLIVPLMGKDNCRYSKLEKADILELTVRFLNDVPKTPTNDTTVSYREGYEACLKRVSALLPRTSLDRKTCERVHDFVQQSLRTTSPPCHTCSSRTSSSARSPLQHETLSNRKCINMSRRENRASVTPERAHDAPRIAAQAVWRPCSYEPMHSFQSQKMMSESMSAPNSQSSCPSIQICRMMRPDDANIVGNVHGGTILKMIEEAGCIIGTRHCNTQPGDRCVAALARVERTDFLYPMFIGEVAHVSAEITFTSKRSVEVQVNVESENILTGAKKLTNKATLWYVPLSLQNVDKIIEVPSIEYSSPDKEELGRKRYEAQKLERLQTKEKNTEIITPVFTPEPYTVGFSHSSLIHLVGPSDCTLHGFVHGGVTMKLMDEVAGIVAVRHCKTNVVTASVDAINFHRKIKKGCVITISGRMTFTSNKSMEIEVFVDADQLVDKVESKYRAATAFFTYISLDKQNKPLPVPPLKLETKEEQKRFDEGNQRYLQNKAKRVAEKEQKQ
ncbi:Cytosolic acyl coenzyme A thioester hydrolase [Bagarius yarrelli]|uniref:palmitoyl-CoA hydrolase n=1 Tax=Bagarius yarrelli TaxID=175774 RepID=A0A556U216_BAGYA|nr:Cytosolic acyl coenzyme A thioester hydrolase [Bagarius yarrelli]